MMQEIGKCKFKQATVPEDAVNLKISPIYTSDATKKLVCPAIYARF